MAKLPTFFFSSYDVFLKIDFNVIRIKYITNDYILNVHINITNNDFSEENEQKADEIDYEIPVFVTQVLEGLSFFYTYLQQNPIIPQETFISIYEKN